MIEQAVYGNPGAGGYRILGRSPGVKDDWLPEIERLCMAFGERPPGVACPAALFVQPFDKQRIAVVQVADLGTDDAGRPGALGFRVLFVPRPLYYGLGGDVFFLTDGLPAPVWASGSHLPVLSWDAGAPPPRRIEDLHKVLDVPYSATLLGGVQSLLDGGRVVFERPEPEPGLVRGLWALLPASSRCDLWPATFAFANAHRFHVAVTPRAKGPEFDGYLTEAEAGDYPEGRYELALQFAVESGDQRGLDRLLSRRSGSQTLQLATGLLLLFVLVPLLMSFVGPAPPPPRPKPGVPAGPPAKLELLPPVDFPDLDRPERDRLAASLGDTAAAFGSAPPAGSTPAELTDAIASLDAKLGTPDPRRDPGPLRDLGPIQRQLQALLWKHAVPDYNVHGPNTVELVEKLRKKLEQKGKEPKR